MQCILCLSFLHLFFRNSAISYIKLQWLLRLLVNSGSLEGLQGFVGIGSQGKHATDEEHRYEFTGQILQTSSTRLT